ncbi:MULTISPECIES: hypothetical protein [unclassified Roseateles]|jgi:hypothetical protein|uniref:hypothetical protein n=1 Tax=unclassified Roseateles TaxID=2626991 RepID=UPI0006FD58D2|nr:MULTISPECIES: hypothetical protein [unclassified Roseateles]KQW43772.1 hypothetical protein ASC81_18720 [Pelomonas sp. Root405]KRA71511.1 hypothetical protein ASD88_17240 [Pelomonas sp. Root662]
MQMAAWQLMACETVVKTVNEFEIVTHELRQVGSSVRVHDASSGLRSGQEVWATSAGDEPIQIAWEWTEIQSDIVALFDPMNILCNVSLIDGQGHALARSRRMLHLNNLVHRLDWQGALEMRAAKCDTRSGA